MLRKMSPCVPLLRAYTLRGAELRAARPRVPLDLVSLWNDRLLRQNAQRPAVARRQRPQRVLDDAILERVKRNRHQASADLEVARRRSQELVDVVKLTVHPDAKRLKRARRRIDPRISLPWDGPSHDRRELG